MFDFRQLRRLVLMSHSAMRLMLGGVACVLGCAKPPASSMRPADTFALAGWTPREFRAGDNGSRTAALDSIARGGRLAIVLHERTIEGDPFPQYLLADGGRVRLVVDSRRDRWSAPGKRSLWETQVDSVTLGYVTERAEGGREYTALSPEAARATRRSLLLLGWVRGDVVVAF